MKLVRLSFVCVRPSSTNRRNVKFTLFHFHLWSLGRYTDQGSKINISWENKTTPRNWLANINVWTLLSFQSSHSVKSLHIICSVVQGHSVQQMINWPLKKIPNEIRSYCLTFPVLSVISPGVQIMLLSIIFFWVSNYYCNPYFICLSPPPPHLEDF